MRTLTGPQLAVLDATDFRVSFRVLIADGDGAMRDYSSQASEDFQEGVEIAVDVDQPVSTCTIRLRRDIINNSGDVLSLAPLRTDSMLNRNAAVAYSPAIDIGRAVQVLVATTAYGVAPSGGDWQNLFEGSVKSHDASQPVMVVNARDLGEALVEAQVEADTIYGTATGRPMEDVIQDVLDDWAPTVTLDCPSSPGFMVTPVTIPVGSLMSALQTIADWIGWTLRYEWDSGTSAWRLTLSEPDRTKTVPDRTVPASRYFTVQKLDVDKTGVRNAIDLAYPDLASGTVITKSVTDSDSIDLYDRQYTKFTEPADSPIDTDAEATALINAMLSDLKDPKAEQAIENHFDWSVELGDLQRYSANVRYDTAQDLAVVSYTHSLSANQHRTTIQARGTPCGKYYGWRKRARTPVTVAEPPALLNFRITAEDATTVTYGWTRSDTVASVWYATSTLAAPLPADPWTTLAAAVTPLSADTITLTKPDPGNFVLLQVEPRNANYIAGDIQRLLISPGQAELAYGASPQGTVSIASNGSWSASIDGPQQAAAYRWSSSTSAYPSDASTQSGGTIVNTRSFDITAGGTLTFGQTVYLTIVPYPVSGATGTPGPSLHIRGSYQTFSASKTVNYSPGSLRPILSGLGYRLVGGAFYFTADGNPSGTINYASTIVPLPDGVTINTIAQELYSGVSATGATTGLTGYAHFAFKRQNASGTQTDLTPGGGGTSNGAGWQTFGPEGGSVGELTTGRTYVLLAELGPAVAGLVTDFTVAALGNLAITYTMPTPDKTL